MNEKPTALELKNLRIQIDRLNEARVELSIAGYLSENHNCDILETIDALEDRFIALSNLKNA
jgi:hypothetical protein